MVSCNYIAGRNALLAEREIEMQSYCLEYNVKGTDGKQETKRYDFTAENLRAALARVPQLVKAFQGTFVAVFAL